MSVQKIATKAGTHYRARVKSHGQEVAARTFERRADAVAWEQDQSRMLRHGEWIDPRRGKVTLAVVAEGWFLTRGGVKRRTRETDMLTWTNYIAPRFAKRVLVSITSAQISEWAAELVTAGKSPATAKRALSTLRSILDHAVADERVVRNAAATAKVPIGRASREGQALTEQEVFDLAEACRGPYGELVVVLAYTGLRWGELAGLQVGDRIAVPGDGLRVQRAVLAGGGAGELFVDALKSYRSRTVPLAGPAAAIVAEWGRDRHPHEWLFATSTGTALREGNWKRQVRWSAAKETIGRPTIRVHDLRHTAASIWLGSGADPKVVQRVLGHASATMTMDLYGHLIDTNLWDSAKRVGGVSGAFSSTKETEHHA